MTYTHPTPTPSRLGGTRHPTVSRLVLAQPTPPDTAGNCATVDAGCHVFNSTKAEKAAGKVTSQMWKDTVVLTDARDMQEAFAIGPDGYVWHYLVGRYADSMGRLFSTGLEATVFNVATLPDGRRAVIAASGLCIRSVVETERGSRQWSAPVDVPLNTLRGTLSIDKIMLRTIHNQLLVGLVVQRASDMGYRLHELWDGVWVQDRPLFCNAPTRMRTSASVWQDDMGNSAPGALSARPLNMDSNTAPAQAMRA